MQRTDLTFIASYPLDRRQDSIAPTAARRGAIVTYPYTDLPAFQERVASFVDMHALRAGAEARVMDLVSEVGEVAKEALKATRYGEQPFETSPAWDEALADVFFSLICLANATNVALVGARDGALEKYRQRLVGRGDAGSGR
jgi:NTP pyrophosphatase (non-canonical NTP hydrolase)